VSLRRLTEVGAVLALALLAACASHTTRVTTPAGPPKPALTATKPELVTRYERQADAVRSLNAAVRLKTETGSAFAGVIKEYRQIGGFILAERPGWIRVIGQAPVVATDIFDMVSDGKTFRMYIPSKKKYLVGPARLEQAGKKAVENLRPQPLYDALVWEKLPAGAPVVVEEENQEQPAQRSYVLTVLRRAGTEWEIDRRIWFDRSDLEVSRVELFGSGGRLESDIRYGGWAAEAGGPEFPRRIVLWRPQDDYRLEIDVTRIRLNESIPPARFELKQPPGSERVEVGGSGGPQ
jgi:outer membrane lipoprotein-sorting protein